MKLSRPVIGILARSFVQPERNDRVLGAFASYVECLHSAGGLSLTVPHASVEAVAMLDGLLLVGGEDPAVPIWWSEGEAKCPVDSVRDAAEESACLIAREKNIPTFGICRGAQIMNCAMGGKIARFAENLGRAHFNADCQHPLEHSVNVLPGTTLSQIVGGSANLHVASRHSCFISTLSSGLRPAAVAEDGTVEAFDSTTWSCLGVQWHPEWHGQSVRRDIRPFVWLVQQARRRMGN